MRISPSGAPIGGPGCESCGPGQRTYVGHSEIPKVLGGMGTAIVSTSKGVMTGHDARREGVGGEVVAYVW